MSHSQMTAPTNLLPVEQFRKLAAANVALALLKVRPAVATPPVMANMTQFLPPCLARQRIALAL